MNTEQEESWDLVIQPEGSLFDLKLDQVWKYRDLLMLLVRRDFVARFKQTVMGPLWFFVQPILTSLIYVVTFSAVARLPTDGVPPILFYLSGTILWTYFSECLMGTSNTFTANQGLFGKVYFPRLVVPLSIIISNLYKFGIQLLLLFMLLFYYSVTSSINIHFEYLYLFPFLIIIMALLGLGFGLVISAMTTKYRDLHFLLGFGIQLAMYATPIVYPLSLVPDRLKWFVSVNPCVGIIEGFKFIFTGAGGIHWDLLLYSLIFTIVVNLIGVVVFKRTEKSFIDTV